MNTEAIVSRIEDQLMATGRLADDPAIEQAVDALVTAVVPAVKQAVLELVEQAAAEVSAQLTVGSLEVVLSEGEPSLVVRSDESTPSFSTDELEARMTVRLPNQLKSALEEAADDAGDSVNSFVLKTLATGTSRSRRGRRIRETLET